MLTSCSSLFVWLAHKCLDCSTHVPEIKCKSTCCNCEVRRTLERRVDALHARVWVLSRKRRALSEPLELLRP